MWFIGEAVAQTKEAIQKTAEAGDVLLQYKAIGAISVLLIVAVGVLFYLYVRKNKDENTELRQLVRDAIKVAEASTSGLAASAKSSDAQGNLIASLTQVVQSLSREVGVSESATRHGLNNVLKGNEGIAGRLERLTDRIDKHAETIGKHSETVGRLADRVENFAERRRP